MLLEFVKVVIVGIIIIVGILMRMLFVDVWIMFFIYIWLDVVNWVVDLMYMLMGMRIYLIEGFSWFGIGDGMFMVKCKLNGVVGYEVDVEIEVVDLFGFFKCFVDVDWSCVGFRLF